MATADNVSLNESAGSLTIESLKIEEEEFVDFLSDYDATDRPDIISEALTIGMRTMQLMNTSQDVEYVERRIGELQNELTAEVKAFQEELDDVVGDEGELHETLNTHVGEDGTLQERIEEAFSEDGPFVERLNEELGEDGERIQAALDPDNEGSPTYRLEQRLTDEIEKVRDKIVEEEAEERVRRQTYLKGGDFEDTVHDILSEIVRQTPNTVNFTGDEPGEAGLKVGDFVVGLDGTAQDIVIEAKTESYSTQSIKEEMKEAIQNRDAAYGVFVTDTLNNLPQTKTGWFHEFTDQNTVVVAMSEAGEQEIEPGYLRMAFHWARMRAVQAYADTYSEFDPEKLQSELEEIEEDIGQFQSIRNNCTKIRDSRRRIEETLDEIERSVKERLESIEQELTKAE